MNSETKSAVRCTLVCLWVNFLQRGRCSAA